MSQSFIYPLRIHIEDTDMSGVVFHSNYLNFMERARSEWAEQTGHGSSWQKTHQIYLVVHSAKIQFLKPARLHQLVEVVSGIQSQGRASMIYDQFLRLQDNPNIILCRAEIKIACVDHEMRPRLLPKPFGFATGV